MLKLFSYWKFAVWGVPIAVALIGGGYWYVSSLQSKNAAQAVVIAEQSAANRAQAGEIVGLKVDKYESDTRQTTLNHLNARGQRAHQHDIITINNQRGGSLDAALLEKPELTADIINRATFDSLRAIEQATDNADY